MNGIGLSKERVTLKPNGQQSERVWHRAEQYLRRYVEARSAARLLHLEAGPFLTVSLVVLLLIAGLAYISTGRLLHVFCGLLAAYSIMDGLLVNTAIAYITRSPRNPLRSTLLTLFGFLNLALGMSVFHVIFRADFLPPLDFFRAIYLSLVTITTLGAGDIQPGDNLGRVLLAVEVLLGVYFLAGVLAVIIGWAPGGPKGSK